MVGLAAVAEGADHPDRDRDHDSDQDRRARELEGVGQPVEDVAHDRAPVDHRPAEVAVDDAPDPRYVPDVERPVEPEVSPQPGYVLRPQRRVEVDARHIGAAGAVHQHERDQRHAQHDDEGGEEPPGHVLREHQLLDVKPGGS